MDTSTWIANGDGTYKLLPFFINEPMCLSSYVTGLADTYPGNKPCNVIITVKVPGEAEPRKFGVLLGCNIPPNYFPVSSIKAK